MRLYRSLEKNLFSPPYRWLPLAVFAFIALAFAYHPQSPLHTFQLNDPDDYMRLNEVINWLTGQGWFDLSQPRMSPGAHTVIHWSRLVDMPIALLTVATKDLIGLDNAAMVASFIVPLLLLGLLLKLLPALAAPLVGRHRSRLAALFLLFAPSTLFNFTPGRVDHHGWQILIAGFGLVALERMTRDARGWRYAVPAAIAFACGLWIGTEAAPWLMTCLALLAFGSAWQGRFALKNAALFGISLAAATGFVTLLAVAPQDYGSRALSWFSVADTIFASLAGAALVLSWLLGRWTEKRSIRLFIASATGLSAALLFVALVPDLWAGPFADFDRFDATIALDNIGEATPLSAGLHILSNNPLSYLGVGLIFIRYLLVPIFGLCAAALNLSTGPAQTRRAWLFHSVFLLLAFLLTIFWQVRVGWFLQMFAIAPITWLTFHWWNKIGQSLSGRPRFWAEILAFLVLAPLPTLLIPAAVAETSFYPNLLLFPAGHAKEASCPLTEATTFLLGPWGYADRPRVILTGANEGPEILFRTSHSVIAGNFIVAGNRDVFNFFNARDDETALAILRKWHVDLVLTCRNIAPFYAGYDRARFGKNAYLKPGPDGRLQLGSDPTQPALIERLVAKKQPSWLKVIEIPSTKDYLLFEVALPPEAADGSAPVDPGTGKQ